MQNKNDFEQGRLDLLNNEFLAKKEGGLFDAKPVAPVWQDWGHGQKRNMSTGEIVTVPAKPEKTIKAGDIVDKITKIETGILDAQAKSTPGVELDMSGMVGQLEYLKKVLKEEFPDDYTKLYGESGTDPDNPFLKIK